MTREMSSLVHLSKVASWITSLSQSALFLQIGSSFKSPINWQIPKCFTYLQETKPEHANSWESLPNNNRH